jgi:hypothetical protein
VVKRSPPFRMRSRDRVLYTVFAAGITLAFARIFYGHMLLQTRGAWSAPLDDVFIHFDYARATARGHPLEWSEGNGYSSGNTSLLYPFVLAVGYLAGFQGDRLMIWAGIVACCSIFGLLLVVPRLFSGLGAWTKYLAPPALFAVGALDWSLFSGMEVALFLGVWGAALLAALDLIAEANDSRDLPPRTPPFIRAIRPWQLGLCGALLVATRPEGATSLAVLGIFVALSTYRRTGWQRALFALLRAGTPAVVLLAVQAIANRIFTGEISSNGAIVKLSLSNPYLTGQQKLDEYRFLIDYVVDRFTKHHLSDDPDFGRILLWLGVVPLLFAKTRAVGLALWASVVSWGLVIALNPQVRWQNERYAMPAAAWVLLLAALGAAILLDVRIQDVRRRIAALVTWLPRAAVAVGALVLFVLHQRSQMRDQIWFFARASRNIHDQHIAAGHLLRTLTPVPKRVMVGDAGAITYASDLPGLDLVGLGGFHDLPFARAGVQGPGATIELIERMPPDQRPDVFALYPSWWPEVATWFGRRVAEVRVHGNVICGGSEKVIYKADWGALEPTSMPRSMHSGETVVDDVDIADLVSEKEHQYRFPHPDAGYVEARVVPDPRHARREVFDAGRRIPAGRSELFRVTLPEDGPARLVARTVAERPLRIGVAIDGEPLGSLVFHRFDGWQEASVEIPAAKRRRRAEVSLTPAPASDWADFHVWVIGPQ